MKYLIKFNESFYDSEILEFLYKLDEMNERGNSESYEGSSTSINYEFDENKDYLLVEISHSGYSDGFSKDYKIYYKETMIGPIKVDSCEDGYSPFDDGVSDNKTIKTEYFESYDDIAKEIYEYFWD